jgi:hypothetical protein
MDESVSDRSCSFDGLFVDLLDSRLPIKKRVTLKPDENCLLYDVEKAPGDVRIFPLAGASRVELATVEEVKDSGLEEEYVMAYRAQGPLGVKSIVRFKYQEKPKSCILWSGSETSDCRMIFHEGSKTFMVRFPNIPEGVYLIFT